jgi:hypothetical protein
MVSEAEYTDLSTPRTTLATGYVRVSVWCKACRHQADADLEKLIDAGRGDEPLVRLRFACPNCQGGSRHTDFVVTAKNSDRGGDQVHGSDQRHQKRYGGQHCYERDDKVENDPCAPLIGNPGAGHYRNFLTRDDAGADGTSMG